MAAIEANFSVADDLLRGAVRGQLSSRNSISLEAPGRIGPIVEIVLASQSHPTQYRSVTLQSAFAVDLAEALKKHQLFGGGYQDLSGAFPLGAENPVTAQAPYWDQWTKHAENIAVSQGLNPHLIAGLLGALVELQDNVYEHSGAPETGLIAYAVTPASFEFVVADRGIGVLRSLRQNSKLAGLANAGAALELAIADGVSRFPEQGRGLGFQQLFRALVGHEAELRFRSDDYVLTLRPGTDAAAVSVLAQVAQLSGFVISVFCSGSVIGQS